MRRAFEEKTALRSSLFWGPSCRVLDWILFSINDLLLAYRARWSVLSFSNGLGWSHRVRGRFDPKLEGDLRAVQVVSDVWRHIELTRLS